MESLKKFKSYNTEIDRDEIEKLKREIEMEDDIILTREDVMVKHKTAGNAEKPAKKKPKLMRKNAVNYDEDSS